jgi:hypothetical protein
MPPAPVDSTDHKAGPRRANVRAHDTEEVPSMQPERTPLHSAAHTSPELRDALYGRVSVTVRCV